jgi:hypothetical protein
MKALLCLLMLAGISLPALADPLPHPAPMTMTPLPAAISGLPQPLAVSTALSMEQRRQQELVANAEKLDQANRALLARNQMLQVQLESLDSQVKILQGDRSNSAIWTGAFTVILGFVLGLIFANSNNRRRSKTGW